MSEVKNGYIKRVTDDDVKSLVLEIAGTNVATTFINCPADPKQVMGVKLPFLIVIIKNMRKYFTFEITILDDKNMHRRFRISNFQSATRIRPFCTMMPIGLSCGWNQIHFNLADFTRRAYGSNYIETRKMQIHANCRIWRIYYTDRLYSEEETPEEFKLHLPIIHQKCVRQGNKESSRTESDLQKLEERHVSQVPRRFEGEESLVARMSRASTESELYKKQSLEEVGAARSLSIETDKEMEPETVFTLVESSVKIPENDVARRENNDTSTSEGMSSKDGD